MNDPVTIIVILVAVAALWTCARLLRRGKTSTDPSEPRLPRCPACGEILYNRRLPHCASCRTPLPPGLRMTDDQTTQLAELDDSCRQAHAKSNVMTRPDPGSE